MNESPFRATPEARRRGLLLIWGAQLMSLALLFGLTYVVRRGLTPSDNHTLAWMLGAVGFMTFVASFLVKRKLLAQAADKRRADLGTTAYVLAFAMCELTGILGFVAYVITGLSYALHSFIIAVVGLLLHFPVRGALDGIEADNNNAGAKFNQTTL
ncbi:MAG: hypothetical protein QOG71_3317 [Pyrinomonadaceae bacterium]|nr:hypothetical protein [Pyrinomonadaceae bacterium]